MNKTVKIIVTVLLIAVAVILTEQLRTKVIPGRTDWIWIPFVIIVWFAVKTAWKKKDPA